MSHYPFSYAIADSQVTITDCDEADSGALNLPSIIESLPVTAIGDSAFRDCIQITSAVIPEGVESIGEYAFHTCTNLESISLPDSLTAIGELAFTKSGLTGITVPGSVQAMELETFSDCDALLTATFDEGVQVLGEQLFLGCDLLESVYLPSTLISFVEPRYSERVSRYSFGSFSSTPKLERIEVAFGGTVYASSNGAIYTADYSTLLRVPIGYAGTFMMHDTTTSVSFYAFEECALLTEITCGAAFLGLSGKNLLSCNQLEVFSVATGNTNLKAINDVLYSLLHVDIQGILTSIDEYTFGGCWNLSEVTLANSLVSIGSSAFATCRSLTVLNSAPLTTVESRAFLSCESLTSIDLGEGLVEIGENSFSSVGLTAIDFPSTLEVIEDSAFSSSDLTSLDLPDGLLSIGEEAFAGCESLYTVKIPGSVTYIGAYAFYDSETIRYIELGRVDK